MSGSNSPITTAIGNGSPSKFEGIAAAATAGTALRRKNAKKTKKITIEEAQRLADQLTANISSLKDDLAGFDHRCHSITVEDRQAFQEKAGEFDEVVAQALAEIERPTIEDDECCVGERHAHFVQRLGKVGQEEQRAELNWANNAEERFDKLHQQSYGLYLPERPFELECKVDAAAVHPTIRSSRQEPQEDGEEW